MDRKADEWESNAHGSYVEWHKDKGRALFLPPMSEPLHHADDVCRKAEHALHGSHVAAADIEVICDSWLALDDGMEHEPPHGLRDKKSRAVIAACVIVTCRRRIFHYGRAAPQDATGIWQSLYWIERYASIFLSAQFGANDVAAVVEAAASTLGKMNRGVSRPNRKPNPVAHPAFVSAIKEAASGKKEWGVAWRWLAKQEGKKIGIFDIYSAPEGQVIYESGGKKREIKQARFRTLYNQNGSTKSRKK